MVQQQHHYFWDAIHQVAAGYPVVATMPASEKKAWAEKYKSYFEILPFVAPYQKVKEALYYAMQTREGRFDFADINEARSPSKTLLRKTFVLHDKVNDRLGLPRLKDYSQLAEKYMPSKNSTKKKEPQVNYTGVSALGNLLKSRDDPMNLFLEKRIPSYSNMRPYQKQSLRPGYVRNAAEWWWKELASKYNKEPATKRRDLVVAEFLRRFPRTRHIPGEALKNVAAMLPRLN